jgi:hypothetical protein
MTIKLLCAPVGRWKASKSAAVHELLELLANLEEGQTLLRIPLDLGGHSARTWAPVPAHLGVSERSDGVGPAGASGDWMIRS